MWLVLDGICLLPTIYYLMLSPRETNTVKIWDNAWRTVYIWTLIRPDMCSVMSMQLMRQINTTQLCSQISWWWKIKRCDTLPFVLFMLNMMILATQQISWEKFTCGLRFWELLIWLLIFSQRTVAASLWTHSGVILMVCLQVLWSAHKIWWAAFWVEFLPYFSPPTRSLRGSQNLYFSRDLKT